MLFLLGQRMKILFLIFLFIFKLNAQGLENTIPGDPTSSFDDSFDSQEEENYERFFSFGRFLHLSGYGSIVTPIGPMTQIYLSGMGFGTNLSYFIDWNVAIGFNFSLNMLPINIIYENTGEITGVGYLTATDIYLKYYFNFFDISKFIASLNPFLKLGAGIYVLSDSIDINETITDYVGFSPARTAIAPGVVAGIGLEYDIFRKMFLLGVEVLYHYTLFSSTNSSLEGTDNKILNSLDYSGNLITVGISLILNFN